MWADLSFLHLSRIYFELKSFQGRHLFPTAQPKGGKASEFLRRGRLFYISHPTVRSIQTAPAALRHGTNAASARTEAVETNHSFYLKPDAGLAQNTEQQTCKRAKQIWQIYREPTATGPPVVIPIMGPGVATTGEAQRGLMWSTGDIYTQTSRKKGTSFNHTTVLFPNIEHCLLKSSYSSPSMRELFEKQRQRQICSDTVLACLACCCLYVDLLVWLCRWIININNVEVPRVFEKKVPA